MLVLAGTDRLDRELMIGQMQGKYQLVVVPDVGHFVHEDAPERTAGAVSFLFGFCFVWVFLVLLSLSRAGPEEGGDCWWWVC